MADSDDLKNAVNQFEESDQKKALLAVTKFPAPIEHAFSINKNNDLIPSYEKSLSKRTQDLPHAYYDAGMFAIYTHEYIQKTEYAGNFMNFKGYQVPAYRVTDIDWPEDWIRAEALYRAITRNN